MIGSGIVSVSKNRKSKKADSIDDRQKESTTQHVADK